MAAGEHTSAAPVRIALVLATVATLVFAIAALRTGLPPARFTIPGDPQGDGAPARTVRGPGVQATLAAGGREVTRTLPAMSFALEPHQSLDRRLPPGPFTGRLRVTFDPGRVRQARIGADLLGAQLIVRRGDTVLLSDFAGETPRRVMSSQPITVGPERVEIVFDITASGERPVALRGLWTPIDALDPRPLPGRGGGSLRDEPALRGMLLVQRLNCVACHPSTDADRQRRLAVRPGPILDGVGERVRPGWLRAWLADPHAVVPGTAMPRTWPDGRGGVLAGDDAIAAERIGDLVHFLVSQGGPTEPTASGVDAAVARTGQVAYHTVGCVACHGPMEPLDAVPARTAVTPVAARTQPVPGRLSAKTTPEALAVFLEDPLHTRPSGVMPAQQLTPAEAEAIASFLLARDEASDPAVGPALEHDSIDPARIARGGLAFAEAGCAACHRLAAAPDPIASTLEDAPPLEALARHTGDGCLADPPPRGAVDFSLNAFQRSDLAAFLTELPGRAAAEVPVDELLVTVERLRCTACHAFHADPGPGPAVTSFFVTRGEADPGDEERLPPVLTDAGGRLTTAWMHDVLTHGHRARPHLAVRMPDYGAANVERLPALLAASAGAPAVSEQHRPRAERAVAAPGCVCDAARLANGWCDACQIGYVASVPVRSAMLFETLDAHGHDFDPASITCVTCQAALASNGFCETCRMGFVDEQLYVSRLTYSLARGEPRALAGLTCPTCRERAGETHWCERCGLGMVGNVAFRDGAGFEDAAGQYRILQAAVQTSDRCETCAVAMITGATCPACGISYADPPPATPREE